MIPEFASRISPGQSVSLVGNQRLILSPAIARPLDTLRRNWRDKLDFTLFSSDAEARRLTDRDLGVQDEIRQRLGAQLFDSEGRLRREQLPELVFEKHQARKELENILHPRIGAAWLGQIREKKLLLAEIPLLFETKADRYIDLIVVTAFNHQTPNGRM